MAPIGVDNRSPERRAKDEQIAAEPTLAPIELPANAAASLMESHLDQHRRPLAVVGVVENGLVRPIDPAVELVERSRVIIVTAEGV